MAETEWIPLASLLFDRQNPRLPKPNSGQREVLRTIAADQKHGSRKIQVLARDILENGLNPTEMPIVMQQGDDTDRYVVLEGNRRLAALRVLENPDSVVDAVPQGVLSALRGLSKKYQSEPIDNVQCVIVKNRDDARHWIELRHTGQNQGAGIVEWASDDASRFKARSGKPEIHSQALDFLENRGELTQDERRKIPATAFQRIIDAPVIRDKLGLELVAGHLQMIAEEAKVIKALRYVVEGLISGRVTTGNVYTKAHREQYAANLPKDVVVKPTKKPGGGAPMDSAAAQVRPQQSMGMKASRLRDRLIPPDCVLTVTDPRIRDIERELRKLSIEKFLNAVSVLLRVFVELSADAYIDRVSLATTSTSSNLSNKVQSVVNDLVTHKKLTQQQAKAARAVCDPSSPLAPSLVMLNQYVHNQYTFPAPVDLRAYWDSLQPFITAIWTQ